MKECNSYARMASFIQSLYTFFYESSLAKYRQIFSRNESGFAEIKFINPYVEIQVLIQATDKYVIPPPYGINIIIV